MSMKRIMLAAALIATAALLCVGLAHRALADDETGDTAITVRAPLDAPPNCTATPPTITLLGLTIDVTAVAGDCAALQMGQTVEVTLASDTPDATTRLLTATALDDQGEDNEVSIQAPLQMIGTSTVTVLGLTVDVSQANLDGADDNSQDGNSQGIDLTQLMVGQVVDLQLASNQPPLSATELEVKNFANGVEVDVEDQNGDTVDDTNDDGTSDDDVTVEVDDTVTVQAPVAGTTALKRVKKTLHFQTRTNGGVVTLSGLPTGRAKVVVTRVHNGQTSVGRKGLRVKANTARSVHMRLHTLPSQ